MLTLALNAKGFSLSNALACAQLSDMAYDPPELGVTLVQSALAHAVIVECGAARLVGFRGTACPRDFLTDGQYWRRAVGEGVEVHAGFDEGVNSLYSDLVKALKYLPAKPLFFVGHSYGGACAVRFADLWDQRRELRGEVDYISGVYTFGQPRVYNRVGAGSYDARLGARTFRVVFEEDIVARLPLFPPPLICHLHEPYIHCGQEIFLPVTGGYDLNPSRVRLLASDLLGLSASYRRSGILGVIDDPFADHAVAKNYVARLTKECGEVQEVAA